MNLPFEILFNIFQHLDDGDLATCRQSCRNWDQPAHCAMYIKIHITTEKRVLQYIAIITTTDLGKFANEIDLGKSYERNRDYNTYKLMYDNYTSILTILGKFCPTVQIIKLSDASQIKAFHEALLHQMRNGNFRNIAMILPPRHCKKIIFYHDIALLMCERMDNMYLTDSLPTTASFSLQKFTNLKKLRIDSRESLVFFDRFLDSNTSNIPNSIQFRGIMLNNATVRCDTDQSDSSTNLSVIKPFQHLQSFRGYDAFYSDQEVKYIMLKFPALRDLVIDSSLEGAVSTNLSEDIMVDFFNYALYIPVARVVLDKLDYEVTINISYERATNKTIARTGKGGNPRIEISRGGGESTAVISLLYFNGTSSEGVRKIFFHYDLIRNGRKITKLELCYFDEHGPYRECYSNPHKQQLPEPIRDKLANSNYLGFVLRSCGALKSLTLRDSRFGNIDVSNRDLVGLWKPFASTKVIMLLTPAFLASLSKCLSSLKFLTMELSRIGYLSTKISAFTCVPHSSLDNISFTCVGNNVGEIRLQLSIGLRKRQFYCRQRQHNRGEIKN